MRGKRQVYDLLFNLKFVTSIKCFSLSYVASVGLTWKEFFGLKHEIIVPLHV